MGQLKKKTPSYLSGSLYRSTHQASAVAILGKRAPVVRSSGILFLNYDRWTARFFQGAMHQWYKRNPCEELKKFNVKKWVRDANGKRIGERCITIADTPEKLPKSVSKALIGGIYHECWHSKFSRTQALDFDEMWEIFEPRIEKVPCWGPYMDALRVWGDLFEDLRIEHCGNLEFSGAHKKMVYLQEFILQQEARQVRGPKPIEILARTMRDVGFGYAGPNQDLAFEFYESIVPGIVGLVSSDPFHNFIERANIQGPDEDLAYLEIALDFVQFLLGEENRGESFSGKTSSGDKKDQKKSSKPGKDQEDSGQSSPGEDSKEEPSQGEDSKEEPFQGEDSKEEPSQGEDSKGETSQGEDSKGETSQGEPSQGEDSKEEPSQGETSQGETSQGEPSQGEDSKGETSQGEPSQGEDSKEEPSQGETSQGETSQGRSFEEAGLSLGEDFVESISSEDSGVGDFSSMMGSYFLDKMKVEEEDLEQGEALWYPYDASLDEFLYVQPSKDGKAYDADKVKRILREVRKDTSFLRSRLRKVFRSLEMVTTLHGVRTGSSLSDRMMVDSYCALRGGEIPDRAYCRPEETIDSTVAVAMVMDQSGSMKGVKEKATAILLSLADPLSQLRCAVQVVGFRTGKDPSYSVDSWNEKQEGGVSDDTRKNPVPQVYHRCHGVTHDIFKTFEESFSQVRWRFANVKAVGMTPLADGLQLALSSLNERTEAHRIIFVFTDGKPDPTHEPVIRRQLRLAKKCEIHVVGVGFGQFCRESIKTFEDYVWSGEAGEIPRLVVAKLSELLDWKTLRRGASNKEFRWSLRKR